MNAGHARQAFANRHAGEAAGDGLEFAADLGGGVRLHVEGVVAARAAPLMQEDHRFRPRDPAAALRPQQSRQRQAEQAETADLQQAAAGEARAAEIVAGGTHENHLLSLIDVVNAVAFGVAFEELLRCHLFPRFLFLPIGGRGRLVLRRFPLLMDRFRAAHFFFSTSNTFTFSFPATFRYAWSSSPSLNLMCVGSM